MIKARKAKIRSTPQGRAEHRLDDKARKAEIRSTPEGKKENRENAKKAMAEKRSTLEGKEKNRLDIKKRRDTDKDSRDEAFEAVQGMSMVDPSILHTDAFKILSSDWDEISIKGPEYTCAICMKQEWLSLIHISEPTRPY